jgi:hypothetical protein
MIEQGKKRSQRKDRSYLQKFDRFLTACLSLQISFMPRDDICIYKRCTHLRGKIKFNSPDNKMTPIIVQSEMKIGKSISRFYRFAYVYVLLLIYEYIPVLPGRFGASAGLP